MQPTNSNCIVKTLRPEYADTLHAALEARCWDFTEAPYAFFKASHDKTNVVFYTSGKLVVQGKGAQDFVEFILEPEVLHEAAFAQEQLARAEECTPHAGMDESGKGDFFGPLVACAAYADQTVAAKLEEIGVCDCKLIKSDARLMVIAKEAMQVLEGRIGIVIIGPEAYNRMYSGFHSLNPLLAWAHARALENLLQKVPDCPRAIADQFGNEKLILNALQERGRKIELDQHPKAESDIAVAAASIFARASFLKKLEDLGKEAGIRLPKGAGTQVDEVAAKIAQKGGRDLLAKFGKMHFRTSYKALGLPVPPKPEFHH